jgi:exodeoxyribonuclease V beta subunit
MAVRRELDARGVSSVYLSDRESLFTSQEAADMVHWLKACAEPGSERLVRKALASNSLALPLDQLIAWQEAELAWEAQMQRFAAFQQVWRQQGVLVMLYRLLDDFALPTRLQGEGERSLTNLLHLAEWLQQAEGQLDGEQALIRHLSDHLGLKDEQQLLRLESDEARVQVITIHKSKGLEYPLVLLPFIGGWKKVNGKIREVTWRHEGGRYQEVSGKSRFADAWERADDERLSEDLRLLYVALTRARFAVWLGLGPLVSGNGSKPELHESAIGYLLTGGARFDSAEQVHAALKGWTEACDAIQLEEVGTASDRRLPPSAVQSLEPARPAPDLQNLDDWWIASYSAIRYQGKGEQGDGTPPLVLPEASTEAPPSHRDQAPECAADATAEEHLDEPALEPVEAEGVMHQLPAGSLWGTFLHSLLEWAAGHRYHSAEGITYRGFAAAVADDAARNALLQRRCRQRGIEPLADDLSDWLQGFLRQPWSLPPDPAGSLCAPLVLADLTPEQLAVELEFLLSSNHFDSETLDRWVCAHTLQGAGRPAALPNRFNGLFKGFIDLVVVHEGRYFVIDWKSNQLGPNDRAYTPEAMREAILHKRYDLQYVLYLLALHRQLRARLPDYDYDRHIGGAIYVFLRGSASPSQGLFHDRPPRQLIEALDRGFRGQLPAGEVL